MYEDEMLEKRQKKIRTNAHRVMRDYRKKSDGKISLTEALVGILAKENARPEIPSIIITDSEGDTDSGLVKVLNKLVIMMKTPTGQTVNFLHPKSVELAEELCHRHSVSDGYPERDACCFLDIMVNDKWRTYNDLVRNLPQYVHDIRDRLDRQFGQVRVELALHANKQLYELLSQTFDIVTLWEEHYQKRTVTKNMVATDRVDSGLTTVKAISEQSGSSIVDVMNYMIDEKNGERIPYRSAMNAIRGIPDIQLKKEKSKTKNLLSN